MPTWFKKKSKLWVLALCFPLLFIQTYYLAAEPHTAFLSCIVFLVMIGLLEGRSWNSLEKAMCQGISEAIPAFLVIGLIGILSAVWMMSGTIPSIIYYGLSYISARWFYMHCLILCSCLSSFCGSAIFTVTTLGSSLISVAHSLGLSLPIAAGAIVCGAAFGDKCSPLSDTTNLAASVAGVSVYTHVRHLLRTAIPSMLIALVFFIYLGHDVPKADMAHINDIKASLATHFHITPMTLLPPCIVMVLAVKRCPTLITFSIGILAGLFVTLLVQHHTDIKQWMNVMQHGYQLASQHTLIESLVNRGGLQSAMWGISLIGLALAFGSLLKELAIIHELLQLCEKKLRSRSSLIVATGLAAIGVNVLVGEQYLAIILPAKAFKQTFDKYRVARYDLSRTLEDCGTLINPLVPWGICGSIFSNQLGVPVYAYIPFSFLLYISPLFTVFFACMDRKRAT